MTAECDSCGCLLRVDRNGYWVDGTGVSDCPENPDAGHTVDGFARPIADAPPL
jgi:hypothetical protein